MSCDRQAKLKVFEMSRQVDGTLTPMVKSKTVAQQATIIWNPNSGSAARCTDLLDELRARSDVQVFLSRSREHARELAAAAVDESDLVIAAGGDGSINAVIPVLVETRTTTPFGVIPLGSGNDFARNLEMPLDPRQAVEQLLSADLDRDSIDLDLVEGTFDNYQTSYVNMATGGNSGDVLNLLDDEVKQRWGPLCYLRGAVDVLSDLQVYSTTARIDGEQFTDLPLLNILVANGRCTGGGLNVAPHARLDDGLLDVLLILDGRPIDIAAMSAQLLVSDYTQSDQVIWRQARDVELWTTPQMRWTTDGESVCSPDEAIEHCQFKLGKGLKVICGRQVSASA